MPSADVYKTKQSSAGFSKHDSARHTAKDGLPPLKKQRSAAAQQTVSGSSNPLMQHSSSQLELELKHEKNTN
jgi:hypothetical protein